MHMYLLASLCFAVSWAHVALNAHSQRPLSGLNDDKPALKRIAIVGGGTAGLSAAHALTKLGEEHGYDVSVVVLERFMSPFFLGSEPHGDIPRASPEFSLGAEVWDASDSVIQEWSEICSTLGPSPDLNSTVRSSGQIGLWNGRNFIFNEQTQSSRWSSWWNEPWSRERYGHSSQVAIDLVRQLNNNLSKLAQEPIFPFSDLNEALHAAGLLGLFQTAALDYIGSNGIADEFAEDVVDAMTRNTHFQGVSQANAWAAISALRYLEPQPFQIDYRHHINAFSCLFRSSISEGHYNPMKYADFVLHQRNGTFVVSSTTLFGQRDDFLADEVVITVPRSRAKIYTKPPLPTTPPLSEYGSLFTMLVTSRSTLDPALFNVDTADELPDQILTSPTKETSVDFYRISYLGRVNTSDPHAEPEYIYHIVTPEYPTFKFFGKLFGFEPSGDSNSSPCTMIQGTGGEDAATGGILISDQVITWCESVSFAKAYPKMRPLDKDFNLPPIKLSEGLWYTAGLDEVMPSLETSALMGKNVARLMVDGWR